MSEDERTTESASDDPRAQRLRDAVARLPREITPPAGAWEAIRARIETRRVRPIAPGAGAGAAEPAAVDRARVNWWIVGVAAAIVIAVTLSLQSPPRGKAATMATGAGPGATPSATPTLSPDSAAVAARPPAGASAPTPAGSPAARPDGTPAVAIPAAFVSANPVLAAALREYRIAAGELEAAVATHTATLEPSTRDVVRRSMATIDTAIAELVAALGENPRDATVGKYLAALYGQKLDFLKRVRALPAAGM